MKANGMAHVQERNTGQTNPCQFKTYVVIPSPSFTITSNISTRLFI
jgi:hypothetical protein